MEGSFKKECIIMMSFLEIIALTFIILFIIAVLLIGTTVYKFIGITKKISNRRKEYLENADREFNRKWVKYHDKL